MRGSHFEHQCQRLLRAALCVSALALSTVSQASDAPHERGAKSHGFSTARDSRWRDERAHSGRHAGQRNERRHEDRRRDHYRGRDWDRRHERRGEGHRHRRPDWHYHGGRYWAPPSYRGRYCHDRRHYHGVHYHVAAHDYYEYYYPRYRSYGARPHGADASLIITIPLF